MHSTALGTFLIKRRFDLGLTRQELATKSAIGSAQFIYSVENGAKSLPVKHVKAMAKALGVSVEVIVDLILKDVETDLRRRVKAA